jgi:hypothetical protein
MILTIGRRILPINHVIVITIIDGPIGRLSGMIEPNLSNDTRLAITNSLTPISRWDPGEIPLVLPLISPIDILAQNRREVPVTLF